MTTAANLELTLEAQGSLPNFRYDILQPLLQGRAPIEGVTLKPTGPAAGAGFFENPRFREGAFDLLDTNWGDLLPGISEGWDMACLPVFIKRKPVYNYLWVRTDRGIEGPKDLEGKTIATGGYTSAITIYTRGFLQHFYGVDLTKLRWISGAKRWEVHDPRIEVDYPEARKSQVDRLLDGEADAGTGDITDVKAWDALESNPQVKRLFPDYQALNQRLFKEHGIFTPVHIIAIGGRTLRQHPGLARRLYDAFQRSCELAYQDALGDGSSFSMTINNRELIQTQLREWGDVYKHGISANRNTIDYFLDYCHEQGVTGTRLSLEQVFPKETLET